MVFNREAIDIFWPARACRARAFAAAGRAAKGLVCVCVGLWLIFNFCFCHFANQIIQPINRFNKKIASEPFFTSLGKLLPNFIGLNARVCIFILISAWDILSYPNELTANINRSGFQQIFPVKIGTYGIKIA